MNFQVRAASLKAWVPNEYSKICIDMYLISEVYKHLDNIIPS